MAAFAGFAYAILSFSISWVSLSNIYSLRKKKLRLTDARSQLVNEVLNGVRVIRLYGWSEAFLGKINTVRPDELHLLSTIGHLFRLVTIWL